MNGRCNNDPLDAAEEICGICGGEFCSSCVITTRNRRSSRVCKQCAIEHSGLRTGSKSTVASRRQVRSNTKVLSGADSPTDARTGFLFFDDPGSDFGADLPVDASEDQPDEVLTESAEVAAEPKRRRFGRLGGRRKEDTTPVTEDEPPLSPETLASLEQADEYDTAPETEAEPTIADPGPSATELLQRLRATDIPAATHPTQPTTSQESSPERRLPAEPPADDGPDSQSLGLQAPAPLCSEPIPKRDRQEDDENHPALDDIEPASIRAWPERPADDIAAEHQRDRRTEIPRAAPSAPLLPADPQTGPSFPTEARTAPAQRAAPPTRPETGMKDRLADRDSFSSTQLPIARAERLPIPRPDLSQSPFATTPSAGAEAKPLPARPTSPAVTRSLGVPQRATRLPMPPTASERSTQTSTLADSVSEPPPHVAFAAESSQPSAPPALGTRPVEHNGPTPVAQPQPSLNPDAPGAADTDADGNWIPPLLRGMVPPEERAESPLPKRR